MRACVCTHANYFAPIILHFFTETPYNHVYRRFSVKELQLTVKECPHLVKESNLILPDFGMKTSLFPLQFFLFCCSFRSTGQRRGRGNAEGTPEKGTKQARQSSLNLLPISCTAAALGALPGPSFCRLSEHEQKWKIFYKFSFASRYICNSGKAWGGWLSGVPYASAEP